MKTLTVWKPLSDIEHMHNRLSDSFFGDSYSRPQNGDTAAWTPLADISEDEKAFTIVLELPGLKKSDIDVRMQDGWLEVSGERPQPSEQDGKTFNRIERAFGPFTRKFRVPDDVDAEGIGAKYRDGELTIALPRKESAKPRAITVKAG